MVVSSPVSIRYATTQPWYQTFNIRVSYQHTTTTISHISWRPKPPGVAAMTSERGDLDLGIHNPTTYYRCTTAAWDQVSSTVEGFPGRGLTIQMHDDGSLPTLNHPCIPTTTNLQRRVNNLEVRRTGNDDDLQLLSNGSVESIFEYSRGFSRMGNDNSESTTCLRITPQIPRSDLRLRDLAPDTSELKMRSPQPYDHARGVHGEKHGPALLNDGGECGFYSQSSMLMRLAEAVSREVSLVLWSGKQQHPLLPSNLCSLPMVTSPQMATIDDFPMIDAFEMQGDDGGADDEHNIAGFLIPDDEGEELQGFQLHEVPESVTVADPVAQEELLPYLNIESLVDLDGGLPYDAHRIERIPLSHFQRVFEVKHKEQALNLLRKRVKLEVDERYRIAGTDKNLLWQFPGHYLDYILTVSKGPGLDACLPRTIPALGFTITIHPREDRDFNARYGPLGFNPDGCMFYLGAAPSGDLWLALKPVIESDDKEEPDVRRTRAARMSRNHWKLVYMFVAYALQLLPEQPYFFIQGRQYGYEFDTPETLDVHKHVNVKEIGVYSMSYTASRALHRTIKRGWHNWVRNAPESWTSDGWLFQHDIISVIHQCGQNQQILESAETLDTEREHWRNLFDFKQLRYLTVALATHVQAHEVTEWEARDTALVMGEDDHLYDSPDQDLRQVVDLQDLPLYDEHGQENRVYTVEGRYRPRIRAHNFDGSAPACGLLLDLTTFPRLMVGSSHSQTQNTSGSKVTAYPQAFMKGYGHVQARGTLPQFQPILDEIHTGLGKPVAHAPESDNDDADSTEEGPTRKRRVVEPIAFQSYTVLMHRTRHSAKLHDVQQGKITSALSGAYANNPQAKRKWKANVDACKNALPHHRFSSRVTLEQVPRAIRNETVLAIYLEEMEDDVVDGVHIFDQIVRTFCRGWGLANILDEFKTHLLVLRPIAYPAVYQWMTYGLCTVLELIWEYAQPFLQGATLPPPELVELTAVVERTLAFAHTGNTKVLSRALMKPLWIVQSLLEHGVPMFPPALILSHLMKPPIVLPLSIWPMVGHQPATASERSQIITYGDNHFQVFLAHMRIALTLAKPAALRLSGPALGHELHMATQIAQIALSSLISEIKQLVTVGVEHQVEELRASGDPQQALWAATCETNLESWLRCRHPLAYGDKAYEYLLKAIVSSPTDIGTGLPAGATANMGLMGWARDLIQLAFTLRGSTVPAPFITPGSALLVFKVALDKMKIFCAGLAPPQELDFLISAFVHAAEDLHIHFVPSKPRVTAGRGRSSQQPVYNAWVSLSDPSHQRHSQVNLLDPAVEARQRAEAADPRAQWSATAMSLQSLPTYLPRRSLPTEWDIKHASLKTADRESILNKTYRYVFDCFSLDNFLHQFALFISICVAMHLPYFGRPDDQPHDASLSLGELETFIRDLPWTAEGRGFNDPPPFIVMLTVYIIAFYDSQSPLRVHHLTARALPPKWASKHTNKGITGIQLVRLGLAKPLRNRIFRSARFGEDWELLSMKELKARSLIFQKHLKNGQYGPFYAMQYLFGRSSAITLARLKNQVQIDPLALS
ncbi:hypothetical protein BDN72DRAFT_937466 [Pluteus cervinus]|uniref:Uncharacterized protein n=1 Tax=Pluteus cervinus TaxID=181527 RepID=A0ACD3AYM9_9AGAR|nr:hypothetical protein BDN72DRAFT_937466 [Pluteus cervinus]